MNSVARLTDRARNDLNVSKGRKTPTQPTNQPTDDVITDQNFHQPCPLSRSNNRNKIKNNNNKKKKKKKKLTEKRENINVGLEPGTFRRKRDHSAAVSYPLD